MRYFIKFKFLFLLLVWYLLESLYIHPHYLSYFNQFAGGPKNGWKFLVDSNIDWGQDLKGLRSYIRKEKISDVIFSYFGTACYGDIGFSYQPLLMIHAKPNEKNIKVNSLTPEKEILAISVTHLQGVYLNKFFGPDMFFWLKRKKPIERIGYSIYVYDITNDFKTHEYLAHVYWTLGEYRYAIREVKRSFALKGKSKIASLIELFIKYETGLKTEALDGFERSLKNNEIFKFPYNVLIRGFWVQRRYSEILAAIGRDFIDKEKIDEGFKISYLAFMIDPENVKALETLAWVEYERGRFEKSLLFAERILKIESGNKIAKFIRSKIEKE